MSWFIAAKCPVDAETKEWLEVSFNWLIDEISAETLLANEVVLPTAEYFPDPLTGKPGDVRRIHERVCRYMDIEPKEVDLQLYSKAMEDQVRRSKMPKQIGHPQFAYKKQKGKYSIRIEAAQASKAEVVGLANAGGDTINSIKQAGEFRITRGGTKLAGLLVFVTVLHALEGPRGPVLEEEHDIVYRGAEGAAVRGSAKKCQTFACPRRSAWGLPASMSFATSAESVQVRPSPPSVWL